MSKVYAAVDHPIGYADYAVDAGQAASISSMKKPFTTIAVGVFGLVALLHIFRLTFGWEVIFDGNVIPLWVSGLGVAVAGGLAIMLWRESR